MNGRGRFKATAFAPATVANVAVGFDILGFPIDGVGDRVTVERIDESKKIVIDAIQGVSGISSDPEKNTATIGLLKLCRDRALPFGFRVSLEKGIPLGSGMGGSAASAVGAIVAANSLLEEPLSEQELLGYALEGEAFASGAKHADNVAPCLLGGLVLCRSIEPPRMVRIPLPEELLCVVVHPELRLDTREARAVLSQVVPLKKHIQQSAKLASFLAGCFRGDLELIGSALSDELIEPQRAHLIPGFHDVKSAAMAAGALGCSISGAGPSVFAWVRSPECARKVCEQMVSAFRGAGVSNAHFWTSKISLRGARLE